MTPNTIRRTTIAFVLAIFLALPGTAVAQGIIKSAVDGAVDVTDESVEAAGDAASSTAEAAGDVTETTVDAAADTTKTTVDAVTPD